MIRHLLPIPAVLLAAGVLAVTGAQADSTSAVVAKEAPRVVPAAKLVKAVGQRERWRARAVRAERVLRHEPSVQEAISLAAFTFGVDAGRMSRIAFCESRFDPSAKNRTSSAAGLFQFIDSTWAGNRYGSAGFSVYSPLAASLGAAYHMSRYGDRAWECRP